MKRSKKKVLLLGTSASAVLNFRIDLISELLKQGHSVIVYSNDFSQKQKEVLLKLGAVPKDYDLSRASINPFYELMALFRLYKHVQKEKPDVVFSYFVKPALYGTLISFFCNIPKRIAMIEGLGFPYTNQPRGRSFKAVLVSVIQNILYSLILPLATKVIFLNPDDKLEIARNKKNIIENSIVLGGIGVNLSNFTQPKFSEDIVFTYIGRIMKEKGISELLAASVMVKSQHPNVKIQVIGAPDNTGEKNQLFLKVKEFQRKKIINYLKHSDSIPNILSNSSVFVLPSYREGVPRSTQEALASGLPVITTDVPGCRETVKDQKNGFLVKPFDEYDLRDKMLWFIKNKRLIKSMGDESRKIAEEKFDISNQNKILISAMDLN